MFFCTVVEWYNAFDLRMEVNLYGDSFFLGFAQFEKFLDFVPEFVELNLGSKRFHFYLGGPF